MSPATQAAATVVVIVCFWLVELLASLRASFSAGKPQQRVIVGLTARFRSAAESHLVFLFYSAHDRAPLGVWACCCAEV